MSKIKSLQKKIDNLYSKGLICYIKDNFHSARFLIESAFLFEKKLCANVYRKSIIPKYFSGELKKKRLHIEALSKLTYPLLN